MHIVQIRRSAAELSAIMAQMRIWLDHHRIDPTLFDSAVSRSGDLRLRLQLRRAEHAAALAQMFDGVVFGSWDAADERAA